MKLLIFCSGGGTNFQEVINFTKRYPKVKIQAMVCNKKRAYAIQRAHQAGIPVHYVPWFRKQKTREEYDQQLVKLAKVMNQIIFYYLVGCILCRHFGVKHFQIIH